jgi:hypothetical protein
MTITVDGTFVTFSDSTKMQSANWRNPDSNTSDVATSFAVGTYFLVDTQTFNSRTSPLPLDGWGRHYTGPVIYFSAGTYGNFGNIFQYQALLSSSAISVSHGPYTGTWVSRGSNVSQALVVRIA